MNWTEEKANEVFSAVMREAVTDEKFRAKLLADPRAAVKELTGIELPADLELRVTEQEAEPVTEGVMSIVLPPMVADELSEEEMEQVAGGAGTPKFDPKEVAALLPQK